MPYAGTAMPAPLTAAPTPVSATLAANEALAVRRRNGQAVLPLAFGEAGLPVHPALRGALSAAAGCGGYGPVAGLPALREAAAGYWQRRGLPTSPGAVVCGPGSKPLIFGLLLALGADVAGADAQLGELRGAGRPDRRACLLRAHAAWRRRDLRSRPARPGRPRGAR